MNPGGIRKTGNISILLVIAMMISGIFSFMVVLLDTDRPACYQLLWLLPVFFCLDCILVYPMRRLLFTRISVTLIVGLYWIRMVATPIFMVLGGYAVVPENTSWQAYLDQAYVLECYESLIVFLLLLGLSRWLKTTPLQEHMEFPEKIRYSTIFWMVFGLICLFFFGMMILYPDLIRYQFITIFGAPESWRIRELPQRSLDGTGSGPLGILVTNWCRLIFIMQIMVPAVLLGWILNHRRHWSELRSLLTVGVLVGLVTVISTEGRGDSLIAALSLILTYGCYCSKKQRKYLAALPVLVVLGGALALWSKSLYESSLSSDVMAMPRLSVTMTAYFSGPQNIAASIEAMRNAGGADPQLLWGDLNISIPDFYLILNRIVNYDWTSTNMLFNRVLYGPFDTISTDQIVPAIGQGCMNFGYLLAPIIPAILVLLAVFFEYWARRTPYPIIKNICYMTAIKVGLSLVAYNFALCMSFLWYTAVALLIAFPMYIQAKRSPFDRPGPHCGTLPLPRLSL